MQPYLYLPMISIILFLGFLWLIRSQLQDDSVSIAQNFPGETVMFIFPHPDDEITCAGTIKMLNSKGCKTILITLTRGEAGDSNGMVDASNPSQKKIHLGELRQKELEAVGKLLLIDHLEILDFPDGGIKDISADVIKQVIREKITHYQPTILVTYDDRIGLYGHPDHRLVASYVKEIFWQLFDQPGLVVKKLYQVTLPKPMIATALKISATFRQSYSSLTEEGLPTPTFAVKITKFGKYKRLAMLLHQSQKPTFDEMQPYFDKVPPSIYFQIFDKEYFAEVGR